MAASRTYRRALCASERSSSSDRERASRWTASWRKAIRSSTSRRSRASLPVEKVPGASVFAGTINQSGALEVGATSIGRDTTLTLGEPEIVGLHPAPGVTPTQLIESAAIAELPSEHPLARAVLRRAKADGVSPPDPDRFSYTPGKGITCVYGGERIVVGNRSLFEEEGLVVPPTKDGTVVLVGRGGRFYGSLEVADVVPKPVASSRW